MRAAASISCCGLTGENTPDTATARTPSRRIPSSASRIPPASRGEISRPSNSWPPRTRKVRAPSASRSSAGQSTSGGSDSVAGSARRSTAVGARRFRSSRALVRWVVPTITAPTRRPGGRWRTASRSASRIPEVTSAVVGRLAAPASAAPSMRTASVLVPPTSTPMNTARFGRRASEESSRARTRRPGDRPPPAPPEWSRGPGRGSPER